MGEGKSNQIGLLAATLASMPFVPSEAERLSGGYSGWVRKRDGKVCAPHGCLNKGSKVATKSRRKGPKVSSKASHHCARFAKRERNRRNKARGVVVRSGAVWGNVQFTPLEDIKAMLEGSDAETSRYWEERARYEREAQNQVNRIKEITAAS